MRWKRELVQETVRKRSRTCEHGHGGSLMTVSRGCGEKINNNNDRPHLHLIVGRWVRHFQLSLSLPVMIMRDRWLERELVRSLNETNRADVPKKVSVWIENQVFRVIGMSSGRRATCVQTAWRWRRRCFSRTWLMQTIVRLHWQAGKSGSWIRTGEQMVALSVVLSLSAGSRELGVWEGVREQGVQIE